MLLLSNYISIRFINPKSSHKNMKEETGLSLNRIIDSDEDHLYEVAERLREEGYDIAGHMRVRRKNPSPNMIGVLKDRAPVQASFLGIENIFGYKLTRQPRAFHYGRIWFDDEDKGAIKGKNWVYEANGTKEMFKINKILEDVASPHGITVQSKLYHKHPKRERYIDELHQ
jgi:hypothetical protein